MKNLKRIKAKQHKDEQMAECVGLAYHPHSNKLSVLSSALWILAKGGNYEKDAKEIIEGIYPEFFKD